MRAASLIFFGIALLGLHQPVLARGGGGHGRGGSSSGDSSGDSSSGDSSGGSSIGDSSGGSSSGSGSTGGSSGSGSGSGGGSSSGCYETTTGLGGSSSDPFNYMYRNQWLYKFVGSYYNGSVEIEATIDMGDVSCEDQKPVFKQKLDAVLMVGQEPTLNKPSLSPYMFSIVGWKEGTKPGGMPSSDTSWVSPDARLIYESISTARSAYSKYPTWNITNQKSGNGYSFGAVFVDNVLSYDESRTVFSISPCNGSQPVDFHMEADDKFQFMYKTPQEFAQNRTHANGTFDGTSATLSITGGFKGRFMNWYSRTTGASNLKYGTYKLKFSGNLDRPHSHTLSTTGQTPSWTENRDLLPGGSKAVSAGAGASTTCVVAGSSDSGGLMSRAEVGKTVSGLAALVGLVAIGMGMVFW